MKTKIMFCTIVLLLSALTGSVYGGLEGHYNTFYGTGQEPIPPEMTITTPSSVHAGGSNTSGNSNTFVGYVAGRLNTTGYENTFLGNGPAN